MIRPDECKYLRLTSAEIYKQAVQELDAILTNYHNKYSPAWIHIRPSDFDQGALYEIMRRPDLWKETWNYLMCEYTAAGWKFKCIGTPSSANFLTHAQWIIGIDGLKEYAPTIPEEENNSTKSLV